MLPTVFKRHLLTTRHIRLQILAGCTFPVGDYVQGMLEQVGKRMQEKGFVNKGHQLANNACKTSTVKEDI
jgi:hypothetical protein